MPEIVASYRHSPFSAEPEQLNVQEIWAVGRDVRGQIAPDSLTRALDFSEIEERVARVKVNGVSFGVAWDLDHEVLNPARKPVMGVTEYDESVPDCVMVAINGPKLSSVDYLLRSTIAHELGHVMFDAPRWIRLGPAPSPAFFGGAQTHAGKYDPREVRANEFMGGLLVPPSSLRVDFMRAARRHRLQPSRRPSAMLRGAAAYDNCAQDADAVQEAVFSLAELYGVSQSFMRVRLERYDLLRSPTTR